MDKRQNAHQKQFMPKVVAILFLFILLSPCIAETVLLFRVGKNFLLSQYEGVTPGSFMTALVRFDVDYLQKKVHDNYDFKRDARIIKDGIGGWKFVLMDYFGFIQRMIGRSYVPGGADVYRLENRYLTILVPEQKNTTALADHLTDLNHFLKSKQCKLLYVQLPWKTCKRDPKLPKGCPADYANINADHFLKLIRRSGIATIDLRDEIHKADLDHYSLFFRTDHHWTPEAGFWAFQFLVEKLRIEYGFTIDPVITDTSMYDRGVYPNLFLGSWGKRTGKTYIGLDDFTVMKPKFRTDLTVVSRVPFYTFRGTFEGCFLGEEFLEKCYYLNNTYGYYSHRIGHAIANIKNNKPSNHHRVLLIHDSFSHVVLPLLALVCEELSVIDLRRSMNNDESFLPEMINEFRPDLVLFLYSPIVFSPFSPDGEPCNDIQFFDFM